MQVHNPSMDLNEPQADWAIIELTATAGASAVAATNCVPINCTPSPESPAKRITTDCESMLLSSLVYAARKNRGLLTLPLLSACTQSAAPFVARGSSSFAPGSPSGSMRPENKSSGYYSRPVEISGTSNA
jgi:hypothetical protein